MSTFIDFDPENPETWPEFTDKSDDGIAKDSDWWIVHTASGATGQAILRQY